MNGFRNRVLAIAGAVAVLAFPAFAETYNTTGTVTSVTPQYRNVNSPVTVQDCRDVQVPVYGNSGGVNTEGAILGGIVGGIVGNQVGGGSGREAATGVGAMIGAIVGGNSGNRQTITGYRTERQCTNRTVNESRRELTDYLVTYEVFGVEQTANVATPYRVGDTIPVRVTIGLR